MTARPARLAMFLAAVLPTAESGQTQSRWLRLQARVDLLTITPIANV
jgi:hypothetical protein